jgi:hypothetical protein
MAYGLSFIRDTLTLNDKLAAQLAQRLAAGNVPLGSPVLIAARELRVVGDFRLFGHDLVLLADQFDGGQGQVIVSAPPGEAGRHVTVGCRKLLGLKVLAPGGEGAAGGPGAPGTPGKPGKPGFQGRKPGGPGGAGGPGGRGADGGDGGSGGEIEVLYLEDAVPGGFNPTGLQVPGGPSGPGGPGGPGGIGGQGGPGDPDGADGPDGPAGPDGADGDPGLAGSVAASAQPEPELYQRIGPLADPWAAYRLRVGTFDFRAFTPGDPVTAGYLDAALVEFDRVLALQPANAEAARLRDQVLSNQNIFGLPRDIDIIPDFPRFEDVVTSYGPMVLSLFQTANSILALDIDIAQKKADLGREIAHLEGLAVVLNLERQTAQAGLEGAQAEAVLAQKRLQAVQKRLSEKEAELQAHEFDLGGMLTTFAVVGGAIVTIATGGTALVAVLPELVAVGYDLGANDVVGLIKSDEAKEDFKAASGDLKTVVEGGKAVVSLLKAIESLNDIPQADAEYKQLLREAIDAVGQKKLAELHVGQAQLALRAAAARQALAVNDLQLANQQLAGLQDEIGYLRQVAVTLIRSAQGYMDTLIKYAFLAARALEIYTFADLSSEIRYDYGYLHPDREEDLLVDDAKSLEQLLAEYTTSWSRFVGIVNYRNRYEQYFLGANLVHDIKFISIRDPQTLANFRATHDLSLQVDLSELPPSRHEAKAEAVYLALVGVTAAAPAVALIVEHSGTYEVALRDGSTRHLVLHPRPTVTTASKSALQLAGAAVGTSPLDLPFWGRGVSTTWHLSVEDSEILTNQVDFSQLSELQIGIGYQSFLVTQ